MIKKMTVATGRMRIVMSLVLTRNTAVPTESVSTNATSVTATMTAMTAQTRCVALMSRVLSLDATAGNVYRTSMFYL